LPSKSPIINDIYPDFTPKLLQRPENALEGCFVSLSPQHPDNNASEENPKTADFLVTSRHSVVEDSMLPGDGEIVQSRILALILLLGKRQLQDMGSPKPSLVGRSALLKPV
jgi:hypothetical protein